MPFEVHRHIAGGYCDKPTYSCNTDSDLPSKRSESEETPRVKRLSNHCLRFFGVPMVSSQLTRVKALQIIKKKKKHLSIPTDDSRVELRNF